MLTIKAFTAESALGYRPPAPETRTFRTAQRVGVKELERWPNNRGLVTIWIDMQHINKRGSSPLRWLVEYKVSEDDEIFNNLLP